MPSRTGKYAASIAVVGVLVLSACGSGDDGGSGDAGGVYNWGVNAELSGPLSFYGASIAGGVKSYVDEVNAAGGINGHKIVLAQVDNAGEQSRAAANATQLITANKAIAIFGNTLSSNCAAAQPIVERYKVPMGCLSVAKQSDYVFNLGPDSGRAGTAMIETAKKLVGKPAIRAAVLEPTTLTGQKQKDQIVKDAPAQGFGLVSVQDFEITATDLSSQVAGIVAARPDVVLTSNTGPGLLAMLRGLRAAGVDVPVVWSEGTANLPSLADSNDPNVYALTVHQIVDPASATGVAAEYVKAATPQLKGKTDATTVNGGEYLVSYSIARLWGEALKQCGFPCTGEQLRAQLEKTRVELPGIVEGSFGYDGANHYPWPKWYVQHVVGAKAELVGTFDAGAGS